jgi:hypothetical protein
MSDGLTEKDAELLAEKLIEKVHERKHNFWIEPEQHYKDHARWRGFDEEQIRSLHDLLQAYRQARSLFWKAFLGFAIVGAIAGAAIGMGFHR